MGKKKTKADAAQAETTTTNETPIENQVEPAIEQAVATTEPAPEEPAPKKEKRQRHVAPPMTLMDLAYAYFAHLEEAGKSEGTVASYKMEYKTAMGELGEATPLADLTPEKVGAFFTSKRVMKLRSGKNKSQLSIDKTRRVLRLALVWAEERAFVAKAPLPEAEPAKK